MKQLSLSEKELCDAKMISLGLFRPLEGFMGKRDLISVEDSLRLSDGFPFPVPVTLDAKGLDVKVGDSLVLKGGEDFSCTMEVEDVFEHKGSILVGGRLTDKPLPGMDVKGEMGWLKAAGIVETHPFFRYVEYAAKSVLEVFDGVVVAVPSHDSSSLLSANIRMKAGRVLSEAYFPKGSFQIRSVPYFVRGMEERERVLHAVVLKNMGLDLAVIIASKKDSIKDYLPLLKELGMEILVMDTPFYCKKCGSMATDRTCPHRGGARVYFDMERANTLMRRGNRLPEEYVRPEVARSLVEGLLFGAKI